MSYTATLKSTFRRLIDFEARLDPLQTVDNVDRGTVSTTPLAPVSRALARCTDAHEEAKRPRRCTGRPTFSSAQRPSACVRAQNPCHALSALSRVQSRGYTSLGSARLPQAFLLRYDPYVVWICRRCARAEPAQRAGQYRSTGPT